MTRPLAQATAKYHSGLYRIVFECRSVKVAVLLLFLAFFIQPIAPAYAEESAEVTSESETVAESPTKERSEVPAQEADATGEDEPESLVAETESADEAKNLPEAEESEITEDRELVNDKSSEAATTEPVDTEPVEVEPTDVADVTTETGTAANKSTSTNANTDTTIVNDQPQTDTAPPSDVSKSTTSTQRSTSPNATTGNDYASTTMAEDTIEGSHPTSDNTTTASSSTGGGDTQDGPITDTAATATTTATSTANETETPAEENVELGQAEDTSPEPTTDVKTEDDTVDRSEEGSVKGVATTTDTVNTSTTSNGTMIEATAYVVNDQNRYQFAETECVSVGDGSFYCSKDTVGDNSTDNGVYTRLDDSGDQEIFYREEGEVTQITDNQYEDLSPEIDPATGEIVWHRLIDGRYQIMHYDLDEKKEMQLTHSGVNNMEPAIDGNLITWQQWHGGDWEIILYKAGETTRLTDNNFHDVAPTIRDGFVMWHTTDERGEKLLSVYEIATGITSAIADPDGGQVENPRFVLVYDTTFDNGDVVTKQYNPETGEISPIGSQPAPLPARVPDPEPAGETRALIQNKATSTEEELLETARQTKPATTTPKATGGAASGTASSSPHSEDTNELELDLATSTEAAPLPLTDYDLIVEPIDNDSSSAQAGDTTASSTAVQ